MPRISGHSASAIAAVSAAPREDRDGAVVTRAEFDALVARVTRIEHARDADDAAWVRAIAAAVGSATFTTRELRDHARVDPALRRVSTRQLGARLRRLRDHPIGGLVVRRHKRDVSGGFLWSVLHVVDDMQAETGAAPPPGAE